MKHSTKLLPLHVRSGKFPTEMPTMKFERFTLTLSLLFQYCSGFQRTATALSYRMRNPIHGMSYEVRIARMDLSRVQQSGTADESIEGEEVTIENRRMLDKNVRKNLFGKESDEEKAVRVEKRRREEEKLADAKRVNMIVALVSALIAGLNYLYQYTHPISAIQLLSELQKQSSPISTIGRNGKPTVVDFWAPWCENCKAEAPTLFQIESEYRDRVNFVMINGDDAASWDLVERFRVDAIPHLALVSSEGDVETALIGIIPAKVLRSDLDIMILNAMMQSDGNTDPKDKSKFELPFVGFDAFKAHPEDRRLEF